MQDPAPDGFGTRLAWARKLRGLSQHELANRIGRREKDIARWEKGENEPTGSRPYKLLADALLVSADFLVGRPTDERDVQAYYELPAGEKLERRSRRNGTKSVDEQGRPKRRRPSGE